MATKEIWTNDFGIYEIDKRKITDDYTLRKSQHDRRKLRNWLNQLLLVSDIVFWHDQNGKEEMVVGTLLDTDIYPIGDAPVTVEFYRKKAYLECYYIRFITLPDRKPMALHVDNIRRFMLKNDNIREISNKAFSPSA